MTRFERFQPGFAQVRGLEKVRIETYSKHGETTKSVMQSLMKDRQSNRDNKHLSDNAKATDERYYKWLEAVEQQLRSHLIPRSFKLAYLSRDDLGLTHGELCHHWQSGKRGVSVRKVLNRLQSFNEERGTNVRPCRPHIPFLLKVLRVHYAPFHFGFVGTGLCDRNGQKSSIHFHAPLDFNYLQRTVHSQPVAWTYYDDGYWEPGGAYQFVFEC